MSFQATEWARGLPLHSLSAKFTLMMIASYAGTDDSCYPKLSTLAADTLQSESTVARRIRELEKIGVLVRMARWTSPNGQVTVTNLAATDAAPPNCRQTSNEIRLLLAVTAEEVRASVAVLKAADSATAETDSDPGEDDEGGQIDARCPVKLTSPPLHLGDAPGASQLRPPLNRDSKIQLNQNPQSPLVPNGGETGLAREGADLAAQHAINRFTDGYPIPITNLPLVRQLVTAMAGDERESLILAAWGYRAFVRSQDRRAMDAHRFIRDGKWPGFVESGRAAVPKAPVPEIVLAVGSDDWKGLFMARAISRGTSQHVLFAPMKRAEVVKVAMPRGISALSMLFDQVGPWRPLVVNSSPWHAWRERLAEIGLAMPETRRLRLLQDETRDAGGRLVKLAEYQRGELFPCEWPTPKGERMPRADTTGPPQLGEISDQDAREFISG